MKKSNLNNKKVLIISVTLIVVVTLGLVLYYNYKINEMNKEIAENINQLRKSFEKEIDSIRTNLTLEIEMLDTNLKTFKTQNEEEINTLNSLINEIEQQSNIKLDELQDELKSIKVESKDFTAIIGDVIQSVVSVGTNKGLGSGAIIDDRGFIVTNYHVVQDAKLIRILTYDNEVYNAKLIGYNSLADIAVLKVDASLDELRFGDSDDVEVGERVIALGNPAGLSFTVTEGIVSAVHRKGSNDLAIYLQTDVPLNPGSSGGPLVNTNSRIIGLNNYKIGGYESLGFAIESNTVKEVVDAVIDQYYEQIGE